MNPETTHLKWITRSLLALAFVFACILFLDEKPWNLSLGAKAISGQSIPLNDFIKEGLWLGCLAGLLISLATAFTARWWLRPVDYTQLPTFVTKSKYTGWFWILLTIIMITSGVLRHARLYQSLWNDEEYSTRRYILGGYQEQKNGDLKFHRADWKTTFFSNRGANNHIVNSVLAKLSVETWRRFADTSGQPFSEAALRLPAYLAGILSIAAVAMLLAYLGRPMLGLMAAFFLAIHPWHLRYSVEVRGYAYLLLFTVLALYFLLKAIQRGQWKYWRYYALFQCLYMLSFPGAVYYAVTLNGGALLTLWFTQKDKTLRGIMILRLFVVNLFSAMIFLLIMGPSLRQISLYLDRDIAKGVMGKAWAYDIWSHIISGIRFSVAEKDFPLSLGLNALMEAQPLLKWFFLGIIPFLILLGWLRATRLGVFFSLVVFPPVLASGLAWLHNTVTGNLLFTWYLLFVLPGLAITLFLGTEAPWCWVRKQPICRILQIGTGFLFLGIYFFATNQPRDLIANHDRQPLRQTAYAMRSNPYLIHEAQPVLTVALGTSSRQLGSYDPRILALDKNADQNWKELKKQMTIADKKQYPLFVTYANASRVEKENPKILKLLEDSEQFEYVSTQYGLEEMFSFRIFSYHRKSEKIKTGQ